MDDVIVEMWLPIGGYEGLYSVSNLGRIRSETRTLQSGGFTRRLTGRVLRVTTLPTGYLQADLRKDNSSAHHYVHRLVLAAFVGLPDPGQEACHNNGCRSDNRAENLRWDTRKANHFDKIAHGTANLGEKSHRARLKAKDVIEIRTSTASAKELAAVFGVTFFHIHSIRAGRSWSWL